MAEATCCADSESVGPRAPNRKVERELTIVNCANENIDIGGSRLDVIDLNHGTNEKRHSDSDRLTVLKSQV